MSPKIKYPNQFFFTTFGYVHVHYNSMKGKQPDQPGGVKEIARRAKVSIATVDRVIHNRTGVSAKTRAKIEKIIQELNYQPNIIASRLASRKVLNLAILLPAVSTETEYWEILLAGVSQAEDEIRQMGVRIERYYYDFNDRTSFPKAAKQLLKGPLDGVLLAPLFVDEATAFCGQLQEKNVPYVFINSDIPSLGSLCYVGPELFRSGYLAAHLMAYCLQRDDKILMVNMTKEIEGLHPLLRKEEGFRAYFGEKPDRIVKTDVPESNEKSIERKVAEALAADASIKAIFVTSSRVHLIAQFLESAGKKDILVMGYDFLPENVSWLQKGMIDFLICQKPQEQAYRGIMTLYQHLVLGAPVEKEHFMPIDIITRENHMYYKN